METIAEINNLAATCIDSNKLKEAIKILLPALELARNQLYHDLQSLNIEESLDGGTASPTHPASIHEVALDDYPLRPSSLTRLSQPGIATSIISKDNIVRSSRDFDREPFHYCSAWKYQQPFSACLEMDRYFAPSWSSMPSFMCNTESRTMMTIQLTTIVIFNFALCHDLLASSVISSGRRNVLLHKAILLYEKVINLYFESSMNGMMTTMIIQDEDSLSNSRINSSFNSQRRRRAGFVGAQQDMIVMAAVNNLIQLQLESYQVRNNYSRLMMALLEQIQMTDYGNEDIQRQVDLQARVFLSNTVLSSNVELGKAAPSA